MRVLLVEDDQMMADAVILTLRDAAYAADWTRDGEAASRALAVQDYDLVLLDLGLPGYDGLELLRRIRLRGDSTPVLIITARDAVEDRIRGLDFGADDYLVKPFDVGELLARMRVAIRRRGGEAGPLFRNGSLTLDPASRQARNGKKSCQLSAREYALLHALMARPGTILSRTQLEEQIYGWNEEVESNAVEFLIHGVRKKLGAKVIKNVRGIGWVVPRNE